MPERCRAAQRCRNGENIHDETGERIDRLGAVIEDGTLCQACTNRVAYALGSLPADVEDLSDLLEPTGEQHWQDPDMPFQPRQKKAPPLPLRESVLALQELIDYEVTVWAESVSDADQANWDSYAAEHSRRPERVARACGLLRYRLVAFVELGETEHRARSLTTRRADGHDEDRTTRARDDYWVSREGWEGALLLVDLHERAERFAGRHPGDRIPVPCARCHRRALVREHRVSSEEGRRYGQPGKVVCRACCSEMSDDDYDSFRLAALKAYGIRTDET